MAVLTVFDPTLRTVGGTAVAHELQPVVRSGV